MTPADTTTPRVYIVDDDADMREALRFLIESVGVTTAEFDNATAFLATYDGHRPACLVTDMRMPVMSGLDLVDELARRGINLPVIVVTSFGDVPSAVRALRAGAVDFLEKPFNNQALLERVQRCLEEDRKTHDARREAREIAARFEALTAREREVLGLIVNGTRNKDIASALGISVKTVEIHRAHVMSKTGAGNLAELVQLADRTTNGT